MIRLETPGPILFRQVRVGERGRLFHCYKFRSMGLDAEARKGVGDIDVRAQGQHPVEEGREGGLVEADAARGVG